MSSGTAAAWITSFDGRRSSNNSGLSFRCRSPTIGSLQSFWHSSGHYLVSSKIQVAADYSDSAADFSKYVGNESCHPFEEIKFYGKGRDVLLTDAEIARTTVEANSKALLVFPGRAHCEPHRHVSWSEFHYVIDDYGDIFFELFDDTNILKEHSYSNPVTVLIGMDFHVHRESRLESDSFFDYVDNDGVINVMFDDYYEEIVDTEITDTLIKWGMPETLRHIHPIYFAKFLAKSFSSKHREKMDYPTNGLSIMGCLRPAFVDEESYLRGLFHKEDDDDYAFDWRDESEKEEEQMAGMHGLIDREALNFSSREDKSNLNSTFHKLEIMTMELFSVYGDQSIINLQDFQDAEPDVLAHCASAIIERFSEDGMQFDAALKALCRKRKGLVVEGANLIGVDSLGMDVRVFFGLEAKTLRFSFNARDDGNQLKLSSWIHDCKHQSGKIVIRNDHPQNVDLPCFYSKKDKKPFPVPIVELRRAARERMKKSKGKPKTPTPPPRNGMLVKSLVPVAHELLNARVTLINNLKKLMKAVPVLACRHCNEIHVGPTGHPFRSCRGLRAEIRRGLHEWTSANVDDVFIPIEAYHLFDRLGRRISHEERFSIPRIPALIELCIQAGVDLPELPTKRRRKPVIRRGKNDIIDADEDDLPDELDPYAKFRKPILVEIPDSEITPPVGSEEVALLAMETYEAWEFVRQGAERLMRKYAVRVCGYCPEVHIGYSGHKAQNCGAHKHQQRNGQHGWQKAVLDDLVPPRYVWHVPANMVELQRELRNFYGQAPAVVELCIQGGMEVPEKYKPTMRLDIGIPANLRESEMVV